MSNVIIGSEHTQSPASRTFGALKDEVARYVFLQNDDESLGIAGDGINEAIRQLNYRAWGWSLGTDTTTLIADTTNYPAPDDFNQPRSAFFLDISDNPADKIFWQAPKVYHDNRTVNRNFIGQPRRYTVTNANDDGLLSLSDTIDAGFVASWPKFKLLYHKYVPYLTVNGDVLDVPTQVESFIMWSAKAYIASLFTADKTAFAEGKAAIAFRTLSKNGGRGAWATDF